jgi:hypothetical protein
MSKAIYGAAMMTLMVAQASCVSSSDPSANGESSGTTSAGYTMPTRSEAQITPHGLHDTSDGCPIGKVQCCGPGGDCFAPQVCQHVACADDRSAPNIVTCDSRGGICDPGLSCPDGVDEIAGFCPRDNICCAL